MQKSQATSASVSSYENNPPGSPYERGTAVLQEPALISNSKLDLPSRLRIWLRGGVIGLAVFVLALALQWTIYDRFLHENGIRIVGSAIAASIAIMLVVILGMESRRQRKAEIARLEMIALLNHHIRNALQAIVSVSGPTSSSDVIRRSVERIEWALGEVLPDLSGQQSRDPRSQRQ